MDALSFSTGMLVGSSGEETCPPCKCEEIIYKEIDVGTTLGITLGITAGILFTFIAWRLLMKKVKLHED